MNGEARAARLAMEVDALLQGMVDQQRAKVLAVAQSLKANLGNDDLLNPHDFPELARDGRFNYEDGHLAGLLAALMAVRARLRQGEMS